MNKQPRKKCVLNSDYDNINLLEINHEYGLRSNYKPVIPLSEYKNLFKGFYEGQDNEGREIYGHWLDYYKVGFRKMVGSSAERTLICLHYVHPLY